ARLFITVPQLLETATRAATLAGVEAVITMGGDEGGVGLTGSTDGAADVSGVEIDARRDVVALPYSSGTTGLPKGVMLTHYNIVANVCQTDAVETIGAHEVLIAALPFYHIYAMVMIMNRAL